MGSLPALRLLRNSHRLSSTLLSHSLSWKRSLASKAIDKMASDIIKESSLSEVVKKFIDASEKRRFRCRHLVYELTFRRLAIAHRFSDIEEIVEAQKKHPDITSEGFAVRLITLLGKSQMFAHAHKLFDELPQWKCPRTVKSFNALLSAALESGSHEKVPELFQHLSSELLIPPDGISFNVLILAFCKMGSLDDALSTLGNMDANSIRPTIVTFNTILRGLYGQCRFSDAEKMWARMGELGISPDAISFNAKLDRLASEGRTTEALELVEEMRNRELKPDIFTFNSLIKVLCKDGNMEEARRTYEELENNDCPPNWRTFETFIPLLCQNGELLYASKLAMESIRRRFRIDNGVLQQVVDGLVKQSLREEAQKLVQFASVSRDSGRYDLKLPSLEER